MLNELWAGLRFYENSAKEEGQVWAPFAAFHFKPKAYNVWCKARFWALGLEFRFFRCRA